MQIKYELRPKRQTEQTESQHDAYKARARPSFQLHSETRPKHVYSWLEKSVSTYWIQTTILFTNSKVFAEVNGYALVRLIRPAMHEYETTFFFPVISSYAKMIASESSEVANLEWAKQKWNCCAHHLYLCLVQV